MSRRNPLSMIHRLIPLALLLTAQCLLAADRALPRIAQASGESAERWYRDGATTAHAQGAGAQAARNLILFVGDGMGITTVTAARILAGQRAGGPGEEHSLSFEQFGHSALVKTYETDQQTPDSAGTMTALVSGIKTRAGVLGIDQRATRGDCKSAQGTGVPTLLELAEDAGLATGIVSTARITHATPAALYAHAPERDWESDADLPADASAADCRDIARQLVEFAHGDGIEVVLGGGRREFLSRDRADPEYPTVRGKRRDGRDLIAQWRQRHAQGHWLWRRDALLTLDPAAPGPVLGLFEPSHMHFEHDRATDVAGEPSLAEMTRFALRKLAHAEQGYFLMVEAARIDHAHHAGNAHRALTDTLALDAAVRAALELTSTRDTLILVTADHSHTLSFAGYPVRGNPILGKVVEIDAQGAQALALDANGKPYATLAYANGPGHAGASDAQGEGAKRFAHEPRRSEPAKHGRPDLRSVDTTHPDHLQEAMLPRSSETHGGEDVALYALGADAAAARGVIEQNVVFHLFAQAHPAIRALLCARGACEDGVPIRLLRTSHAARD